MNWLVLSCFAAAALPLLASNQLAANELGALELAASLPLRCRCATAACFKPISCN
jgi:hypothetical protein